MILDQQSIAAGYIPKHSYKSNFLDYYEEFVKNNKQANNRHIEGSFAHFKAFLGKGFLAPIDVAENLCERFRKYLLDRFNGDTPANYFSQFKRVVKAATKEGYFRVSPAEEVGAKTSKSGRQKRVDIQTSFPGYGVAYSGYLVQGCRYSEAYHLA